MESGVWICLRPDGASLEDDGVPAFVGFEPNVFDHQQNVRISVSAAEVKNPSDISASLTQSKQISVSVTFSLLIPPAAALESLRTHTHTHTHRCCRQSVVSLFLGGR